MSTPALQALTFDVDGPLAGTESAHGSAFDQAFAERGLDWVWEQTPYTELPNISGGKERIRHNWQTSRPTPA
jgi:beta-phosphoglucomutase-like phosphatase (HAD superfamily)